MSRIKNHVITGDRATLERLLSEYKNYCGRTAYIEKGNLIILSREVGKKKAKAKKVKDD